MVRTRHDNKKRSMTNKHKIKTSTIPPRALTSIAGPEMTLCKSRAHNDVVWDVGTSSYTTSYPGPSCGDVVFAGPYHRADTTELFLCVFAWFSCSLCFAYVLAETTNTTKRFPNPKSVKDAHRPLTYIASRRAPYRGEPSL